MKKLKLILLIFIVAQLAGLARSKYGRYNDDEEKSQGIKPKSSKGLGVSAWGLVFLIVAFILIGVGVYYFAIFYPILCKKERKYDRIELTRI